VVEGPDGEHLGEHRQCLRCRLTSQQRANARYDASDRGQMMRSTYESSPRRYGLRPVAAERSDLEKLGGGEFRLLNANGQPVDLPPIVP
jgi:hypothetical protein